MKRARIYMDGFYEFTPQEYMVIEQLFIHCPHVTVALTLDAPYEQLPNDLHVFRSTWRTYAQLREMALQNGVAIEKVEQLHENVRHKHEELRHLEAHYDDRPVRVWPKQTEAIVIGEATTRRAEMEGIAREIIRLVRDEGYRYRDIALLIRNVSDYRDVLKRYLQIIAFRILLMKKNRCLIIRSLNVCAQASKQYGRTFVTKRYFVL